jgi:glycosyltransferase involved in cell wall biosynthesis
MSHALRIALLVDPLSVRAPNAARVKAARHARELLGALEARGHAARLFGIGAGDGPEPDLGGSLLSFQPEAVIAYDALSPAAWLGSRIARRRRAPLLLIEAGSFAEGSWMERAAWRLGEVLWGTFVRRSAGALIALDPVARDQALREGFQAERVAVVPHGVDLERFRPGLPCPLVGAHRVRGRILLHPGPLDQRSGAELLIAAFARTLGQRDDWSLVLAGEGRAPSRLRACADRLGVGARVHVLDTREQDQPGLFASATLVALPERDDAPQGAALARACACGVPVLAADAPRSRALVGALDVGLCAAAGDLEAWTDALRRAASSPEARRRWGGNGLEAARTLFDWRRVAERVESELATVAQRLPRPQPTLLPPRPVERAG